MRRSVQCRPGSVAPIAVIVSGYPTATPIAGVYALRDMAAVSAMRCIVAMNTRHVAGKRGIAHRIAMPDHARKTW